MGELIRLQVVDDHPAIHAAVAQMVDREHFSVCATAHNAAEAVGQWASIRANAIILDLTMPGGNGESVLDYHRRHNTGAPILVFTGSCNTVRLRDCLRRGALGCLPKLAPAEEFSRALKTVAIQRRPFRTNAQLMTECLATPSSVSLLSPREREVAQSIAMGMSSKQIAALLGISAATVNIYRSSLMKKIGVHNAAEVTRYVLKCPILAPSVQSSGDS
jgi:DNA-binding NarL/FixJ family response regulator